MPTLTINQRRLITGTLLITLAVAAYMLRVHDDLHDYEVDYRAGQRILAGEDLYQAEDGHYVYRYPPGAAILEAPLSVFPWSVAKIIFYALNIGIMFALLWLAQRLIPSELPKTRWIKSLTFLILAKYFAREIDLGQINMIITVLLLLMVSKFLSSQETGSPKIAAVAGMLWGMASTLKPYGLIFLPYFVLRKQWMMLATGLGTIALLAASGAVTYGIDGIIAQHQAWTASLAESATEYLVNPNNTSLMGFFMRSTGDLLISTWLFCIALAALMFLMLWVVRQGRQLERSVVLDSAILMTLIPLISPLGWDYVMLMSAPGVMLLLQYRRSFGTAARRLMIANFVMIGVFITDVVGHTAHEIYTDWTLTTINFLIVVGYLVAMRFKRIC